MSAVKNKQNVGRKIFENNEERESGEICFGNTIINTRVSILNYPKDFYEKNNTKFNRRTYKRIMGFAKSFQFEIMEKI